uniref:Cathepsin d (Lysosomal aspartyl protease) n=1 Tax=Triatoma infestans TaxID=30076 RepID=A0A170WZC2_TRIIF
MYYKHTKYDSSLSTTYKEDGRKVKITYGTGKIKGFFSTDILTLAGLEIQNQTFVEATQVEGFDVAEFDGLLGLAFPSIAKKHARPPFFNMIKQGLLDKPVFSVYFEEN